MAELYLDFLLVSFILFTGIKLYSIGIKKPVTRKMDLKDLSIIVPFRNEEDNLPMLLDSLSKQPVLPSKIIFVNDHSEDNSETIIQEFINSYKVGELIHLEKKVNGKKEALNYGVQHSNSQFILTLDADVILNDGYMNSLQKLPAHSLMSLPVIMQGKTFLQNLFSTEYLFFNAFNFLISSVWPISISGANLIFNSKSINYESQLKEHKHFASGDDFFLLKTFRKKKLFFFTGNDFNLSVNTSAPQSLKSYFDQRVRWIGKSKFKLDAIDALIGAFLFLYFTGGFIAILISLILSQWVLLSIVFVLRFMIDALVYLNYAQRLHLTKNVLMLPFFQLIYPLLFISVITLSIFYKPKWKGRGLQA